MACVLGSIWLLDGIGKQQQQQYELVSPFFNPKVKNNLSAYLF